MLHDRRYRAWAIVGLFLVGTCLSIGRLNLRPADVVRAAPQKQASSPVDHVVISEFRTRGPGGEFDEFVELFNPTGNPIEISGWMIKQSSEDGITITDLVSVDPSMILQPGQYYLIAPSSVNGQAPDQTYSPSSSASLTDRGGIGIFDSGNQLVDAAGLSGTTVYVEGTFLPPLSMDEDRSYEREPGGVSGSCYDTDDNLADFSELSASDPQNLSSPATICAGSETLTPTLTPTNTATSTPVAPHHLVISEFRTRGTNGTSDEFVELFNPSGAAVNIGGWKIKKSAGCGSSPTTLATITIGVVLPAGGHYLVAATGSSLTITADQTFSASIHDEGGIALFMADGATIVDQVGMCNSTLYLEGINLSPLSGNSDQSYARNPIGAASGCYDVGNNASDFTLISPSDPQNKSSPLAMCPGVLTSTPTHTPTPTPTRTPTPTKTPVPGNIVINEFLPHPHTDWNGDGGANVYDEYIEIMNVGTEAVNLKNWKLDDDLGGSSPYTLPDITLEPRAITRFFRSDSGILLSDGGDAVRLLKPGGQTVDIYTYPVVETVDIAWCRLPDGNGGWTFACRPTPGRPNARAASGYLTPTPSSGRGGWDAPESCPLADTLPQGILQAECGDGHPEIWNWGLWGESEERWLETRFKWGLFIQ